MTQLVALLCLVAISESTVDEDFLVVADQWSFAAHWLKTHHNNPNEGISHDAAEDFVYMVRRLNQWTANAVHRALQEIGASARSIARELNYLCADLSVLFGKGDIVRSYEMMFIISMRMKRYALEN